MITIENRDDLSNQTINGIRYRGVIDEDKYHYYVVCNTVGRHPYVQRSNKQNCVLNSEKQREHNKTSGKWAYKREMKADIIILRAKIEELNELIRLGDKCYYT